MATWNPLYASLVGSNPTEEAIFYNASNLMNLGNAPPNIVTAPIVSAFQTYTPGTIPDVTLPARTSLTTLSNWVDELPSKLGTEAGKAASQQLVQPALLSIASYALAAFVLVKYGPKLMNKVLK